MLQSTFLAGKVDTIHQPIWFQLINLFPSCHALRMSGVSCCDFPATEWYDLDAKIQIRNSCIVTNRKLEPGLGIEIVMPGPISYYGKYLNRGGSKVALELDCPGARFHGKVLKIAKKYDVEPSVFKQTYGLGVSTNILYNCVGKDYDSHRTFHCWITDRTIPLDVMYL